MTTTPNPRPVYGGPTEHREYNEDEQLVDRSVGWALSGGCQLTFSDDLTVTVSTSDADQRNGITQRKATREQVVTYARQLLALASPSPVSTPDTPADIEADLTARLAAADLGWSRETGDPAAEPDYIRALARQVAAFAPSYLRPATATPSPVATPDTREAVSAEAIICAGVIVGVGGESDPCVTQEQADRATRLIVRELTKHGLLRPARATPSPVAEDGRDAAIERALAEQLSRLVNPDLWQDTYSEWPNMVRSRERVINAALIAVRAGWRPAVATREASAIARALVLVAQDHGHDKLVLVDTDEAADAVMPVLVEALAERDAKIAELRSLLRARDENLHTEAEGWKDMVSALSAQEARAKAERDLALWLHAEAVWRDQARHGLLDDLVREQTARCDAQGDFREALRQRDQARAERDRLSTLLRGMARRPSQIRREAEVNVGHLANYTDKLIDLTAELDELRERAVVLPQDWRIALGNELSEHGCFEDDFASHVDADLDDVLTAVGNTIESWRPSTGDTDGTRARAELRCTATTTHPLYGRVQCQVQRGHEGIHGRLHSNSHFGVHWEDAVFPEEHAEPEPAWGVDRPVHGHTEQTGDQ